MYSKKVKFVEPLWWYYTKIFFKGFWSVFKFALITAFALVYFYVFMVLALSDWKKIYKDISGDKDKSKSSYVSKEFSKIKN